MESTIANGTPLLYLLIVWGSRYRRFLVLLLRRSLLESHEDDQTFSRCGWGAYGQRAARAWWPKINALSRPIMGQASWQAFCCW